MKTAYSFPKLSTLSGLTFLWLEMAGLHPESISTEGGTLINLPDSEIPTIIHLATINPTRFGRAADIKALNP